MKIKYLSGIFLMFSSLAWAGEGAGFLRGNLRTVIDVKGYVSMNCREIGGYGRDYFRYSCHAHALSEGASDYFVGPSGVPADEVRLTAYRADGSRRTKTLSYDSTKGRSRQPVNLWKRSLFHHGLLKEGENRIVYILKKEGHVTDRGEFVAKVLDGEKRVCRMEGQAWSDFTNRCPSISEACAAYFQKNNFCTPKVR